MASTAESQLASTVLMVRPVRFQRNPLAAKTNSFMEPTDATPDEEQAAAAAEFDDLVSALRKAGVNVVEVLDTEEPHTPDAIFPNNWITFHADGTVVLYPMEAPNRRTERRMDIIDALAGEHGFDVREVIDLSSHEEHGRFLEGTGSLVLDRINHIAYACLSTRTHLEVLADFGQRMNYEVVAFAAVDRDGIPIYHTNVLMNLSEDFAVVCEESIRGNEQRAAVRARLEETGHRIISLNYDQLESFAGNMLEIQSKDGERVIAMSQQARDSLNNEQIQAIEASTRIVSSPIDRIERSAGGSVRCMLAEIHLPRASG